VLSNDHWSAFKAAPQRSKDLAFGVSVDSNGFVLASFSTESGQVTSGTGTYAFDPRDSSWTNVHGDTDSYLQLISYGDTTYGITTNNGIKLFITSNFFAVKTRPATFFSLANYPNPTSQATTITYTLTAREVVTLTVYDLLGRTIRTLVHKPEDAGTHSVPLDTHDLPTGAYIYTLATPQGISSKALEVMR